MVLDVFTESAGHQTSVPVRLAGRVPTVMFVSHCLVVTMDHVQMHLNVTVMRAGKEHIVTFPAAKTAPMENVSLQMNVSAAMDGVVRAAMSVSQWLDVFMANVWIILILVSVTADGKDICVTSHHANWIATMDSVMHLVWPIPPISAYANLVGEERAVTSAALTGDAQIKMMMHVTNLINVFASRMRMIRNNCATTLC